ncbi:hypothetical protein AHAT_23580 [Agarivorans sp. Toyoura001]|uniref:PilN domain-containing protein n=1 Tax=Agarivorans sp. Toyoura001 TaxID=2283141 RepID=UPI0010E5C0EF|nr:PilN domain-containing protein [Agarivorans sp. Toyoura001]GDY26468.1 hypothetical protein AHAT_23580 [Agarivorans sp. Toyoura001]
MKTRINLYVEEFRPKPERGSLRQAVISWGIVGVLALVWGFWQQQQTNAAVVSSSAQRQLLNQQEQQLNKLKAAIEQRALDPRLQREVSLVQQELTLKQLLDQRLKGHGYANSGFSSSLNALASIEDSQIWLTEINIQRGRMALAGQSTSSDAVPKWLKQFKAYPDLSQQQFAGLKIFRDEDQQLHFSLSGSTKSESILGASNE